MPIRFASEAWPRPGLAEPRSASIAGFGNTEPLSSREQKGKDGHDQDKGLVLGSFLVPEIDMIFGDGVGASLVVVVVVVVVKETHMPLPRSRRWAQWIFSLEEVWKEDADMNDRPLVMHCSGLGGGLLSPDHAYDLFFQNHAQMKVYGPSLAMIDNWELRVSQLGLTKATHEYVIYQLLATACGWGVWKNFLPSQLVNPKLS